MEVAHSAQIEVMFSQKQNENCTLRYSINELTANTEFERKKCRKIMEQKIMVGIFVT